MLLTIDIGNTGVFVGAFSGDTLLDHWRLSTDKDRTPDEYGVDLTGLLKNSGYDKLDILGAAVSCVVPSLKYTFEEALKKYFSIEALFIGPGVKTGMPILTDNPREVGSDRIVNAVAAYAKHKRPLIVVDFGTAVTFDHVTAKGEYAGGVIAPGIRVASDALFSRAAKLTKVELSRPTSAIGKNTAQSIQAGIYYGYAGLVDGIVSKIKEEVGKDTFVIATGGDAELMLSATNSIDFHDEFLVLEGLKIIYEGNLK